MSRNEALFEAVTLGKRDLVVELVQQALEGEEDVVELLNDSMIPAMRQIGEKFSRNEVYVPEMMIAARAMQSGLDLIEPRLVQAGHRARAKLCIGTVKGDLHDIGKNLVAMMLKGAGFEVDDLGVDCSVETFQAAAGRGAQVICLSALLTTTKPYIKTVVDSLGGGEVKIVIGGAPVTAEYAREVGADGYGCDANDAVAAVERCLALT